MKSKPQSFAKRANALIKKYSRASFDKTEKDELNNELAKLSQEQESFRESNGLTSPSPSDGVPKFDGLSGSSFLGGNPNVSDENLSPYSTSIIPSVLSGATSMIGNSIMAANSGNGHTKVQPQRIDPVKYSLDAERKNASDNADLSRNITSRNVRDGARTSGEYLANMNAIGAGIDRTLSSVNRDSYGREANMNASEIGRTRQVNAGMKMEADRFNSVLDSRIKSDRDAYTSAAISSMPQMTRDINAIQGQDALVNSLGEDYQIFLEDYDGRKAWQKKKIVKKYIGGNKE